MGGAIPAGHFQLMIVDVDRDDGIRRDHGRSLDDIEAHSAATEDGNGLAYFYGGVVIDDAEGGRHGASHEGGNFEIHTIRDLSEAVFRDDGVFVEGRHPSGVHRAAVPLILCRLGMDTRTLAPVHANAVARLHLGHSGAGFQNHGATLVTHEVGRNLSGPFALRSRPVEPRRCRCSGPVREPARHRVLGSQFRR